MQTVTRKMTWVFLALVLLAGLFAAVRPVVGSPQNASGFKVDKKSIGGTVVNSNGGKPEAGVWVIAETKSLPAPFRKIVVTDDQGRFLVPDLPTGSYELWVRGYGLKDSERVKADCGDMIKLQATNAATPQEAAKIYPASYWTSLIQPPPMSDLPAKFKSQDEWLATLRNGCNHCHELGMAPTRIYTTPKDWDAMFLRAKSMHQELDGMGRQVTEKILADWGARIAAGEVPPLRRGPPASNAMSLYLSGIGPPRVVRSRFNIYGQAQSDVVPVWESLRWGSNGRRQMVDFGPGEEHCLIATRWNHETRAMVTP